ncbi:MAG: PadR family transcriptional regulator [Chloroflexota bacterium]|nr:MAG: PadR family transcriptional regulator [Chloroflexota bacterium]
MARASMGRFAEPALWILVALGRGPAAAATLLVTVRRLDGPVGPATLIGALARLERSELIERSTADRPPMYRLATYSPEASS